MMGHIYLIRNLVNGKGYVGQTTFAVARRFAKHKENLRAGQDTALYRAMRKYGVNNFSVQEIVSCDPLLLNDLEKHYIKFYGTLSFKGHGYNMNEGGDSAPRIKGTWHHTEEWKAAASVRNKGRKHPPRSEAWKLNQSEAHKGKSPSMETRAKLSAASKGKPHGPMPEEIRAKVSASKKGAGKGKPWTEARRLAVNPDHKCSPETRKKISESLRGGKMPFKGKPWSEARRKAQILIGQKNRNTQVPA